MPMLIDGYEPKDFPNIQPIRAHNCLHTSKRQRIGNHTDQRATSVKQEGQNHESRRLSKVVPQSSSIPGRFFKDLENKPSQTPSTEASVIKEFLAYLNSQKKQSSTSSVMIELEPDFLVAELSDFTIYRPQTENPDQWSNCRYDSEMESLDVLRTSRVEMLLFDGIISFGKIRRYVQAIEFGILSIDGYQETCATLNDKIYIQSTLSERENLWYRLMTPSQEYIRYHKPFLWVADLSKHVVNFLEQHDKVRLEDFRHKFHAWLISTYGADPILQHWFSQYGGLDYRSQINANILFLWKEISSIFTDDDAAREPLWKDLNFHTDSGVKEQVMITEPTRTVVTPSVWTCSQQMPFASILDPRDASPSVKEATCQRREDLGFVPETYMASKIKSKVNLTSYTSSKVVVGDVVLINRDQEGSWKDKAETWLAYVQGIRKDRRAAEKDELLVLWLYRPEDTTMGDGLYKFQQELFLSDHCNCEDGVLTRQDVIRKVVVQWYRFDDRDFWDKQYQECANFEYVVRTLYRTDNEEHSFQTLWRRDFSCQCAKKSRISMQVIMNRYGIGDSVWLKPSPSSKEKILEPVVIVRYLPEDKMVEVRRLLRQGRGVGHTTRQNELVWTDEFYKVSVRRIERKIQIRFFSQQMISDDKIPAPYNRGGTGDCCFIVSAPWIPEKELRQGFDPAAPRYHALRGLDLFAGSGGFGRGLEEGQAVEFHYAIDWDRNAVHSYAANKQNRLYFGSVNDYLAKALRSSNPDLIARVGDVDFIAAGSPCQAYSNMNRNRLSEEGKRNASMVASVASFIDLYRPKHAVLENVPGMARSKKGPSAFTQFLATLVAMGYQVQQFRLDAWSLGDAQSRSRLFISITAPGLTPQRHPPLTHAHPPNTSSASLGTNVNNEHFGKRIFQTPAFSCPKARERTSDLPFLGDARTGTCIKFPDHRVTIHQRHLRRLMISQIPVFPPKQGSVQAMQKGLLPEPIVKHLTKSARPGPNFASGWSRVDGDGLIPTIKTAAKPEDRIAGRLLHWSEHRALTIQEARRAQGVPDDVVIVGSPNAQWKQIGNAVSGAVASALGMSLREAWLADQPENDIIDLTMDEDMEDVVDDETQARGVASAPESESQMDRDIVMVDERAQNGMHSETVAKTPQPDSKTDSDIVMVDEEPVDKRLHTETVAEPPQPASKMDSNSVTMGEQPGNRTHPGPVSRSPQAYFNKGSATVIIDKRPVDSRMPSETNARTPEPESKTDDNIVAFNQRPIANPVPPQPASKPNSNINNPDDQPVTNQQLPQTDPSSQDALASTVTPALSTPQKVSTP